LVIGRLRRASEGVKEKPLCQHLPSCGYSISPFVRPSTKVSPMRHDSSQLGSYRLPSYKWELFTWFLVTNGNYPHDSFTWFLVTTIHVLHHSTQVPQQRTIKEQAKNKEEQLSFDRGALISIRVFHYFMISQLINNQFLQA